MRALHLFVAATLVAVPAPALAQHAPTEAHVDFGILPTGPLGPAPCLQLGAIGGPADPCSYKLHVLTPEESTIRKDGEVTFQFHGGGHAIAVYQVSKDTTRQELGQFLCAGIDPADAATPADQPCNAVLGSGAANAAAAHLIPDGKGRVVIDVGLGGAAHPANRVWSPEGRLVSAGGQQFMLGTDAPAGQLLTFEFTHPGRYLIICMNRSHFLNDWMFGFVNVVGN